MNKRALFPYIDHYNGSSDIIWDTIDRLHSTTVEIMMRELKEFKNLHHAEIIGIFENFKPYFNDIYFTLEDDRMNDYTYLTSALEYGILTMFKNIESWNENIDRKNEIAFARDLYALWLKKGEEKGEEDVDVCDLLKAYYPPQKEISNSIHLKGVLDIIQLIIFSHETEDKLTAYAHILFTLCDKQLFIPKDTYALATEHLILSIQGVLQAIENESSDDRLQAERNYTTIQGIKELKKIWKLYGKQTYESQTQDSINASTSPDLLNVTGSMYTNVPNPKCTPLKVFIEHSFGPNKELLDSVLEHSSCNIVDIDDAQIIITKDPDPNSKKHVTLFQLLTHISLSN